MRGDIFAIASALSLLVTPPHAAAQSAPRQGEVLGSEALRDLSIHSKNVRQVLDSALMKDPNNVHLNFLSGLTYDALAAAGSEGRQLARVGYLTALRSDPTFWPANYQLGLLALEDGDALAAQRYFIAAAFYAPDVGLVFYGLARAAFCAGDYGSAALALAKALEMNAPVLEDEFVTAALVAAANGDRQAADSWLTQMERGTSRPASAQLRRRLQALLQPPSPRTGSGAASDGEPVLPSQDSSKGMGQAISGKSAVSPLAGGGTRPTAGGAMGEPSGKAVTEKPLGGSRRKMATVDVVIIRREESRSTTSGINLMDALALQFGSTLVNSERSRTVDRLAGATTVDSVTTFNNVNLTVPTVTYSLNIANAAGNKSSINARPTLLVYDGQTAKVFSGGTLTYAASGQLSSQSFTKEVGLSLTVTPTFNDDDSVTLGIVTSLETFVNSAAGSFREAVQTEKAASEITADLRSGETVIVSAGQFNNIEAGQTGTPVLQGLPLVGNLFRRKFSTYSSNDLLILLSLRRENERPDSSNPEEVDRVNRLGDRLWDKLGIAAPDHTRRVAREEYRSSYVIGNPGRGFDKSYFELIGLTDLFID